MKDKRRLNDATPEEWTGASQVWFNKQKGTDPKSYQLHGDHYSKGGIQPIEYIQANGLNFCEGNVVKYITRYRHKGTPLEDLEKIKQYVDFLIEARKEMDNE